MTLDVLDEVKIPYSTIPVFVNLISSQNGAMTTANGIGNDVVEELVKGVPKLSRPLVLIYIKVKTNMILQNVLTKTYIESMVSTSSNIKCRRKLNCSSIIISISKYASI